MEKTLADRLSEAVDRRRDVVVDVVRKLVGTPSPSGQEREAAELVRDEMEARGYRSVRVDSAGNVYGSVGHKEGGKVFLLNGHLDHVPPGAMDNPYSAKVVDGGAFDVKGSVIYGRAAADMKGPFGAMLVAGEVLEEMDLLKGELIISGTVLEEVGGGLGPRTLLEKDGVKPDAALVGEVTNLRVAQGHRGVIRADLATYGKSCHISVQERGINALYKMTKVITEIEKENADLPTHPVLGKSSWGVAKIDLDPNVVNVVPDRCRVVVDVRNTPNFPLEQVMKRLQTILERMGRDDHQFRGDVVPSEGELTCWTGHKERARFYVDPFYVEPGSWLVQAARSSVASVVGVDPGLCIWNFGTESWVFDRAGIPTVGFGPGEERFTHSNSEVIGVEDLVAATKVYALLAATVCGVKER